MLNLSKIIQYKKDFWLIKKIQHMKKIQPQKLCNIFEPYIGRFFSLQYS